MKKLFKTERSVYDIYAFTELHKGDPLLDKEDIPMKKLITLILTLALLLSMVSIPALAEEEKTQGGSAAWPVIELKGVGAELRSEGYGERFRYQTFSGPGRGYSLAGAYLPRKVTATVLGRENGFALIDMEYNGGRRYVYLEEKYVSAGEPEEIKATPVPARTKARVEEMFYGPGIQFDVVRQRTKSEYADMSMSQLTRIFDGDTEKILKALRDVFPHVELPAGARVNVLYEVDGWVCVESDCTVLGKARTWIKADQVTPE